MALRLSNAKHQKVFYDYELDWFLTSSAGVLGESSAFPALVASIEKGGSSGNSGTKGHGRGETPLLRVFETEHDHEVQLARRCFLAWTMVQQENKNFLSCIYTLEQDRLPPGLYGKLGSLSGIALFLALKRGKLTQLTKAIHKWTSEGKYWENVAHTASKCAHYDWFDCKKMVERNRKVALNG